MKPTEALLSALIVVMLFVPAHALAEQDVQAVPLSPPYVADHFGVPIFFSSQAPGNGQIITPGRKHLEIDKSTQRLRAYDEAGRLALETPVSTGKPGIDEKGRQGHETGSGIHRVVEVRASKPWSKDPKVKMLNWIGLVPGVEKGIHSLEPVGEFAHYEQRLGQAVSHGCIRVSRKDSRWLINWMGDDWKRYPLIVEIYDQPSSSVTSLEEDRYLLLLILQEGTYSSEAFSQGVVPSLQRNESTQGVRMKPGGFILYKHEANTWQVVRSSHTGVDVFGTGPHAHD